MKKLICIQIVVLLLFFTHSVFAMPNIEDILVEIDNKIRLESDMTASVTFTEQKPNQGIKVFKSNYYQRNQDNAFLIVMISPEVERDNGYLRIGDNIWMYRRNTRMFQHVNRSESILGTNASAEDFENNQLNEIYRPVLDDLGQEKIEEALIGEIPVYKFQVEALLPDVAYPTRTYWVRQDNYLPLMIEYYSLNGILMETVYFLKYVKIEDKYLCIKNVIVDEFEEDHRTIIEFEGISLELIDDYIFTRAYLESLSR